MQGGSTSLTTLLANTVREDVLGTPERSTDLDADDAVAAVDKGLASISGGSAGVEVTHAGGRERLHVRLGRNFALTASRGR